MYYLPGLKTWELLQWNSINMIMANLVNISTTITVIGIMYKIKSKITRNYYYDLCIIQYEHLCT